LSSGRYVARIAGIDGEAELTFTRRSPTLISTDHTGAPDSMRGTTGHLLPAADGRVNVARSSSNPVGDGLDHEGWRSTREAGQNDRKTHCPARIAEMTGSLFGSREAKHRCSNGAGPATARIPHRVGRYRCAADDEIARFIHPFARTHVARVERQRRERDANTAGDDDKGDELFRENQATVTEPARQFTTIKELSTAPELGTS
jgi:hypothetical protein